MSIVLEEKVIKLINSNTSLKVLASVDRDGVPHVTYKDSVTVSNDGKIQYLELIETSQTNKNLVSSIWFNKKVAISILGENNINYQIKGTPVQAVISGEVFEKNYKEVQAHLGNRIDLSTVWIIDPEEIKEETFEVRLQQEEELHPLIGHLDRYRN